MADVKDRSADAEIPDQQEDPEGYVKHVQEVREEDAELAEQEAELQRKRSGAPEPDVVPATHDISDPDEKPKAKEKAAS